MFKVYDEVWAMYDDSPTLFQIYSITICAIKSAYELREGLPPPRAEYQLEHPSYDLKDGDPILKVEASMFKTKHDLLESFYNEDEDPERFNNDAN